MKRYIRIIVVSYATRKVLTVKEFNQWGLPEAEYKNEKMDDFVKQLCFKYLGQNCNFYMANEKYEDVAEKNGSLIEYIWAFTCSEYFDMSNVEYRWNNAEDVCVEENVKRYIRENINNEIRIKCNKTVKPNKNYAVKTANVQGSKQAYSRIIPLKLLHPEIGIKNIPQILDVFYMRQVLEMSSQIKNEFILTDELCYSWGIMNMLPLLLNKHHRVIIQKTPAGCQIGDRTLDLYLYVMKIFGVYIEFDDDVIILEYVKGVGKDKIEIPIFASFTATSMAIYFALLGSGITIIENASIEPEILFLLETIEKLGYFVHREGRTIQINGRRNESISLKQEISVPVDRNVLVTQMVDAIYEQKVFSYSDERELYLEELVEKLREFNVEIAYDGKSVRFDFAKKERTYSNHLVFGHYPDLCTDWQPLLTTLCADSKEEVVIYDKIFNDRYRYLEQLKQIYPGLETNIFKNLAIIKNMHKEQRNEYLNMLEISLLDIRAAAAVIIGLSKCSGFSLSNVTQLLRGYENLFQISEYIGENGIYEFRKKVSETI